MNLRKDHYRSWKEEMPKRKTVCASTCFGVPASRVRPQAVVARLGSKCWPRGTPLPPPRLAFVFGYPVRSACAEARAGDRAPPGFKDRPRPKAAGARRSLVFYFTKKPILQKPGGPPPPPRPSPPVRRRRGLTLVLVGSRPSDGGRGGQG